MLERILSNMDYSTLAMDKQQCRQMCLVNGKYHCTWYCVRELLCTILDYLGCNIFELSSIFIWLLILAVLGGCHAICLSPIIMSIFLNSNKEFTFTGVCLTHYSMLCSSCQNRRFIIVYALLCQSSNFEIQFEKRLLLTLLYV